MCTLPVKRATYYSRTTAKPGQNERFAEKIVSLRNSTKTMLHTIHQLFKVKHLQFVQKILLSSPFRDEYNFVVSSRFHSSSRLVCSPLNAYSASRSTVLEREGKYWKKDIVRSLLLKYVKWGINEIVHFTAQCCRKYAWYQKSFKLKLFRIEFRTKKSASAFVYLHQERN